MSYKTYKDHLSLAATRVEFSWSRSQYDWRLSSNLWCVPFLNQCFHLKYFLFEKGLYSLESSIFLLKNSNPASFISPPTIVASCTEEYLGVVESFLKLSSYDRQLFFGDVCPRVQDKHGFFIARYRNRSVSSYMQAITMLLLQHLIISARLCPMAKW